MFSNSPDSEEAGTTESLGLDDLDMDYEQIMNYFDNLKVSERFVNEVRQVRLLIPPLSPHYRQESNA